MSHTIPRKPAHNAKAMLEAAHDAASIDGMALYRLSNLVKLAAFACEARRTLEGIHDALELQPTAKEFVAERVQYCSNWVEFEDVTGHVLQDVAMQLDALNETVSNRPFELDKLGGGRHE